MHFTTTVIAAAGIAAHQALAFGGGYGGWGATDRYSTPDNTNNKCTPEQATGYDWASLPTGSFTKYGSNSFSGWSCSNSFGKRDLLTKRTFQSKCITAPLDDQPSISCEKDQTMSIDTFEVSADKDADVECHYDMPDGSTCKEVHSCKAGGTVIQNSQCGGAKSVTFKPYGRSKKAGRKIGVHGVGFKCGSPSSTPPAYSSTSRATPPAYSPPVSTAPGYGSTASSPIPSSPSPSSYSSSTTECVPGSGKSCTSGSPVSSSSTTECVPGYGNSCSSTSQPTSKSTAPVYTSSSQGVPGYGSTSSSESSPVQSSSTVPSYTDSSTSQSIPGYGSSSTAAPVPSSSSESSPGYGSSSTAAPTPSSSSESSPGYGSSSTAAPAPSSSSESSPGYESSSTAAPVPSSSSESIPGYGSSSTAAPVPSSSSESSPGYESSSTSAPASPSSSESSPGYGSSSSPASPSTSSSQGIPGYGSSSSESSPVTSASSTATQPAPTYTGPKPQSPNVLPTCLNTWMYLTTCKDNTDSNCYCKNGEFLKKVYACISSWSGDKEITSGASSYLMGLCAPYAPDNPAVITGCPTTITPAPTFTYNPVTSSAPPVYSTSTITLYSTKPITVTSCAPDITNCPVQTQPTTYAIGTTVTSIPAPPAPSATSVAGPITSPAPTPGPTPPATTMTYGTITVTVPQVQITTYTVTIGTQTTTQPGLGYGAPTPAPETSSIAPYPTASATSPSSPVGGGTGAPSGFVPSYTATPSPTNIIPYAGAGSKVVSGGGLLSVVLGLAVVVVGV